jgi:DNA polymerase III subunit epsilon
MRRSATHKALLVGGYAALVPAVTAAVLLLDLDPAPRDDLLAGAAAAWWALALGLIALVGGVWWIMRGGLRAHDQAARRLAAAARTAATANLAHRAVADGPSDGHAEATAAINALATRAEQAEQTVDERVAAARAELAAERDRLAAVLADLDHPVLVCTPEGLVLLLNEAARHACGRDNYLGVGRSLFSVLDRDDLALPVKRALRGERLDAPVRCGDTTIDFRVGPVTEQGHFSGFVLVGPAQVGADAREAALATEADGSGAGLVGASPAAHGPAGLAPAGTPIGAPVEADPPPARAAPRPVVYDFRLLDLDAHAPGADDDLRSLAFTVLDTETTGLDPRGGDTIVSMGAVRVDRVRVREHDTFDRLVDPGRRIPAVATSVHGITNQMVAGRSRLPAVLADLARFTDDTVLVGHDIAFDLAFLRPVEEAAGAQLPSRVLDILLLSAVLHPAEGENHSLDALARRYSIPVLGRHTALGDALVTAEILVAMIDELAAAGIRTYGEAVAAATATSLAKQSARRF